MNKKIGQWLRRKRLDLSLTQSDLGNVINITYQQIQKYESSKNRIALDRFFDICKAIDIKPSEAIEEIEKGLLE